PSRPVFCLPGGAAVAVRSSVHGAAPPQSGALRATLPSISTLRLRCADRRGRVLRRGAAPAWPGRAAQRTPHPPRPPSPPLPPPADAAPAPPPAPGGELLTPAGFDRPQHDSVALADVPIQWGDKLASFYEELARLERGGLKEPLRIGVHGDSNLTK